jgi:hypothetical protein
MTLTFILSLTGEETERIFSIHWVQGSPLPKEVWNPGGFHV